MNVAYCAGECGNCGNCLGCRPIPVENLLREFFHRLQVAHPSRMGMDQSSPLTSPITPPRGGVVTEWLKASLRDAFNRESQRRFTVFLDCGYAAACASAGGIVARRVGTPPVLSTAPMTASPTSDISVTSWGLLSFSFCGFEALVEARKREQDRRQGHRNNEPAPVQIK